MPTILAIDTSDRSADVALHYRDRTVSHTSADTKSVEQLPRLLRSCLQDHDLKLEQVEVLVVALGPGSFTGIRAGLAFAQGLHAARPLMLLGVSTLLARAHTHFRATTGAAAAHHCCVTLEASRSERYATEVAHKQGRTLPQSAIFTLSTEPEPVLDVEPVLEGERTGLEGERTGLPTVAVDQITAARSLVDFTRECLLIGAAPTAADPEAVELARGQFFEQVKDLRRADQISPLYIKPLNARTLAERGLR